MGKATLAKQRAIGLIGGGLVRTLESGGISLIYTVEYEQLRAHVADLEREVSTLREIVADSTQTSVIAARVLKETMR